MDLEREAKQHFTKLQDTLNYQKKKFTETERPIIQREIDALEFVLRYAREALAQRGIQV